MLGQVDRSADAPAFKQIAADLRAAIEAGHLAPGDRVPSEAQLMDHYGVARMTVRQSLAELRAEGLLVAEHGRGVFVRARPRVRRLGPLRAPAPGRRQGRVPRGVGGGGHT